MRRIRESVTEALRRRILSALASGALRGGDRLPATRALAAELGADPRIISDAYRDLTREGLVVLRARAGAFVAELPDITTQAPRVDADWLAAIIAAGVQRGVPASALAETLASATKTRALSVAVIAGTLDQALGLARELRDDFGMDAHGMLVEQIVPGEPLPRTVRRAGGLVGTTHTAAQVRRLGERTGRPHVIIDVRPDLLSPEWRLVLNRASYVIIADPRFARIVHGFLSRAENGGNARVLVAERDDLSVIPPDAPTYVTEAARVQLGRARLPWRLIARARTLSEESSRAVAALLGQHNQRRGT
jgi:DNA-binding transcriptional regulator YhcF (GntR family)